MLFFLSRINPLISLWLSLAQNVNYVYSVLQLLQKFPWSKDGLIFLYFTKQKHPINLLLPIGYARKKNSPVQPSQMLQQNVWICYLLSCYDLLCSARQENVVSRLIYPFRFECLKKHNHIQPRHQGDSFPIPHMLNPYPTAFPYGNGMVLHFYQQQESSTTKTVHKVINKGLKTYV